MKTLSKEQAIKMLGSYAFNQRTKKLLADRVRTVMEFSKNNDNVSIEISNNWSFPPKPSTAKNYQRVGGTTYKYQVWAVCR